jgi:hypothetical protein
MGDSWTTLETIYNGEPQLGNSNLWNGLCAVFQLVLPTVHWDKTQQRSQNRTNNCNIMLLCCSAISDSFVSSWSERELGDLTF